ncbi:MAG: hypothetical protein K2J12_08125 [Muribaculaceae bacterium]|nr:hypothetical protein [Muribaculaceae bacterium]
MHKSLSLILTAIFALALVACEEDDAELMFSAETISDNNNVKVEYYSPDPCCVPKTYHIVTNRLSSELTIKCTNADNITIGSIPDSNNNFLTDPVEGNEDADKTYTSITKTWTATLIDSNTIRFSFDEIDDSTIDDTYFIVEFLPVSAKTKKGNVSTSIHVTRITESSNPV